MTRVFKSFALIVASICFVAGSAADPHDDHHDHDHGPATVPATRDAHDHGADDHDDHGHDDHGHDHHDHAGEVKLTAEAVRNHGIRVAPAAKVALVSTLVAPARVAFNAEAMAHVGAPVEGRAVEIKARVGAAVRKGDELVVVESPALGEAQSDYLQKRTALAVAEAAVEPARRSAERAQKLHELNQGIALGEVQRREAEVKSAEGAVQSAQAALTAAQHRLNLLGMDESAIEELAASSRIDPKYVVRAPIGGHVIEREVTLGELVSPDKESLLILADLTSPWVLADIPEARLADITIGTPACVQVAGSTIDVDGKITYIAPALDPNTRTGQVRIEVPDQNGQLRPGMFARAELSLQNTSPGGSAKVLAIPEQAVQTIEGKTVVFVPVKDEPNTFASKPVTIGRPAGGMVPVRSGIDEGDSIVVAGTFILKAELGKGEAAHEH
jgi:cobalt-zinc-cadmium efflux system membrane fusion protein